LTDFGKVLRKKHATIDALMGGGQTPAAAPGEYDFPHEIKCFGSRQPTGRPAPSSLHRALRVERPLKMKRISPVCRPVGFGGLTPPILRDAAMPKIHPRERQIRLGGNFRSVWRWTKLPTQMSTASNA
jgi:hypothetical protein